VKVTNYGKHSLTEWTGRNVKIAPEKNCEPALEASAKSSNGALLAEEPLAKSPENSDLFNTMMKDTDKVRSGRAP